MPRETSKAKITDQNLPSISFFLFRPPHALCSRSAAVPFTAPPLRRTLLHSVPLESVLSGILDSNPAAFITGFPVPDSLKAILSEPQIFLVALRFLRPRPRFALCFFCWADQQLGFPHSEPAFYTLLQILTEGGLMRAAHSVAQQVLRLHGIIDLLSDGGPQFALPLLSLFIWLHTKCSMVELTVSIFYKMVNHGFPPDVKNCNRILRSLRDTRRWSEVQAIYKEMVNGVQSTIVTYNTILDSFCKEGKANEAHRVLGEMESQDSACLPNDVTYNVIINGLSKKGEIHEAKKLHDKMKKI